MPQFLKRCYGNIKFLQTEGIEWDSEFFNSFTGSTARVENHCTHSPNHLKRLQQIKGLSPPQATGKNDSVNPEPEEP